MDHFRRLYRMYRTHNCGELRLSEQSKEVVLSGWVQRIRDKGGMVWIDLRDRYGVTQLVFEEGNIAPDLLAMAKSVGREYVLKVSRKVVERYAKNPNMASLTSTTISGSNNWLYMGKFNLEVPTSYSRSHLRKH